MIKIKIIKEPFKNEDGALVMFPFRKGIRIGEYNREEELFFLRDDKNGYKNEYLDDERREKFPYSNIPVFRTIKGLRIYNVTNQILNYNKIYLVQRYREHYAYVPEDNFSELHEEIVTDTEYVSVINDDDANSDKAYMVISDKKVPELELNAKELKNLITLNQIESQQMEEPYIPVLLNEGISKDDVKKAKRLVKEKHSK